MSRSVVNLDWASHVRRLCVLGLLSAACSDSGELVVVQGERIDVHHMPDFQLCGGTVDAYDRGIEFIAEQLGLDPDSFPHLTYTWLDDRTFRDGPFFPGPDVAGRAGGDEAKGVFPYMMHEVVHMLGNQEKVNASTFLTEGLATAFEEKIGDFEPIDPRPYLAARHGTSPSVNYEVAGTFVSYLLSRYGPERFWELNRELRHFSTEGRFYRRFEAVYGEDLDAVVDEFLSGECPEDASPIPLPVSCSAEELPRASDGTWTYARTLDCAEDGLVGGIGGDYEDSVMHMVTFEIDEPGPYDVRRIGDAGFELIVYRCGGCPWLNSATFLRGGEYEAGRYSVMILSWEIEGGSVGFTISPSAG